MSPKTDDDIGERQLGMNNRSADEEKKDATRRNGEGYLQQVHEDLHGL